MSPPASPQHLLLLLALACLTLFLTPALASTVPFTACDNGEPAPTSVRMNCSSLVSDTCVLNKENTYLLQVDFVPDSPASDVESYVAWRSWVEMPLPGQDSKACDDHLSCPLTPGKVATFTYPLRVERFWMRRRYPMVWRLKDDDTDRVILCFNIRTFVKS
ncbi:ecdysteroid-regulated 16 kDa protein-like [Eriocheir sinensis]|uniref:ecdysteroid-regulated 16 kDa protein-like n=1 Tax=Eriocheir sinensis TaxID=95602 RepID=UPI0021C72A52|nr:ecdysteroid-regulated 16 kDa protein-like [Eriocheir sinensis]UYG50031.1 ML1 [Eriocheir sinensis]